MDKYQKSSYMETSVSLAFTIVSVNNGKATLSKGQPTSQQVAKHLDPGRRAFDSQPLLGQSIVKEIPKGGITQSPIKQKFRYFMEFALRAGLSALYEYRYSMYTEYPGSASMNPISAWLDEAEGVTKAYTAVVTLDMSCKRLPNLTPGDRVHVHLGDSLLDRRPTWSGVIMPAGRTTNFGQVTIAIRPENPENPRITDVSFRTRVIVMAETDNKDINRQFIALRHFHISPAELKSPSARVNLLAQHQLFFQCDGHERLSSSNLYAALRDPNSSRLCSYVQKILLPHQRKAFKFWCTGGLRANTAVVAGPSGTGKTTLVIHAMKPFLGKVKKLIRASEKPGVEESSRVEEEVERGRITAVAAANESVDKLHEQLMTEARAFCEEQGLPPPLGFRKHSDVTFKMAIRAMRNRGFITSLEKLSSRETGESLPLEETDRVLAEYKKAIKGSKYPGIQDVRMKDIFSSEAYYLLQLAGAFAPSPELQAAFSPEELAEKRRTIGSFLLSVDWELLERLPKADERHRPAREIIKLGMECLESRAAIVTVSASNGMVQEFAAQRKSHVVFIEEATRLTDAQLTGYWSLYYDAYARFVIGDWRQLPPSIFGPKEQNPFQDQASCPLLKRLKDTDFPVQELDTTRRFGNPETLKLCRQANELSDLLASPDASRPREALGVRKANKALYDLDFPVVCVDIYPSEPEKDEMTGSWYCEASANAVIHDILHRLKETPGDCIGYETPYRAQLTLMKRKIEDLVSHKRRSGEHSLANELSKVLLSTVDSFMGAERPIVLLDVVIVGHIMDLPRTIVAATRAKDGFVIFCNVHSLRRHESRGNHPLKVIVEGLELSRRFRCNQAVQNTLEEKYGLLG
ncbi:hypothetical protein BU24DRAFT_483871 [Aaosphaeria arxii CBS 175.79]|uniref:Uncharacterized protein n=1 Tax=Aaosphaeria arxii CBS 175.79 TaxID=1450172 RepID=A0A6A5XL20_9PLEO|nr:uncharacterized protein BU24DRAFT_483871 [Aaosphaeria arxii CBS 175.79]KAF2013988.1 hypothetical protein BU24DRAFT_483871 [Aaosphaeria arxii CBS 175.79]